LCVLRLATFAHAATTHASTASKQVNNKYN